MTIAQNSAAADLQARMEIQLGLPQGEVKQVVVINPGSESYLVAKQAPDITDHESLIWTAVVHGENTDQWFLTQTEADDLAMFS